MYCTDIKEGLYETKLQIEKGRLGCVGGEEVRRGRVKGGVGEMVRRN